MVVRVVFGPPEPMPTAPSGTLADVIDGEIYVIGGEGCAGESGGVFRTK